MKRMSLKRKTSLRKISKKRAGDFKLYFKRRAKYLKANPVCEFPMCRTLSMDIHHKSGRIGKNLIDTKTWAALCRRCHTWIHDNARLARKLGWIRW